MTDDLSPSAAVACALKQREFVRAVARHLVREPNDAEDLEQEAWLAVLIRPPRSAAAVRAWLSSTLRRVRGKRWRGESRRHAREQDAASREARRSAAEIVAQVELEQRVVQAVMRLREPFRSAILLRYYEDLDSIEIAKRLDISPVAVRARLWRGLRELREQLDAAHDGDRRAWLPALAAACRVDPGPGGSVATSSTATPAGSSSMNLTFALGAAALAVVATTVVVTAVSRRGDPAAESIAAAAPAPGHEPGARSAMAPSVGPGSVAVPERELVEPGQHGSPTTVDPEHAAGTIRFGVVDAATGQALGGGITRFLNAERYGEWAGAACDRAITPGTWEMSVRVPGYEDARRSAVAIASGGVTDLGEIALERGTAVVEGAILAPFLGADASVVVELHGNVPETGGGIPYLMEVPILGTLFQAAAGTPAPGALQELASADRVRDTARAADESDASASLLSTAVTTFHGIPQSTPGVLRATVVPAVDGRFRFEDLPAGHYLLRVADPVSGLYATQPLALTAGAHAYRTLEAPGATEVALQVFDAEGVPVEAGLAFDVLERSEVLGVQTEDGLQQLGVAFVERLIAQEEQEFLVAVEVATGSAAAGMDAVRCTDCHVRNDGPQGLPVHPVGTDGLLEDVPLLSEGAECPRVLDRERREGDSLLPPLRAPVHTFAVGIPDPPQAGVYTLAGLPRKPLVIRVRANEQSAEVTMDLSGGSIGPVAVRLHR